MREFESQSSMSTLIRCGLQYYFRYVEDIKTPPAVAMIRGTAGHKGTEHNYIQKIDSRVDCSLDEVLDATSDEWNSQTEYIEDWEDKRPEKVKDGLMSLMKVVHKDLHPIIQPVEVEQEFIVDIAGQKFRGFPDVIAELGNDLIIDDNKFTNKARSQGDVDFDLQGTIYTYAKKIKNFAFDCAVQTDAGNQYINRKIGTRDESDWQKLESRVRLFKKAVEAQTFYPCDPASWQCSKKWCGYWNICEQGDKNRGAVNFDMKPSQSIL